MIDEKKLIAEIREYIDEYKELDMQGVRNLKWCAMMDALELVESQPKVGEWIPCSERLPEEARAIEVTMYDGSRAIGHFYKSLEAWLDSINGGAIDVIAWKEPSEPWEGGKE